MFGQQARKEAPGWANENHQPSAWNVRDPPPLQPHPRSPRQPRPSLEAIAGKREGEVVGRPDDVVWQPGTGHSTSVQDKLNNKVSAGDEPPKLQNKKVKTYFAPNYTNRYRALRLACDLSHLGQVGAFSERISVGRLPLGTCLVSGSPLDLWSSPVPPLPGPCSQFLSTIPQQVPV